MNLKSLWSILAEAYERIDEHVMTAVMTTAAELNLSPGWFGWAAAGALFGEHPISIEPYMRLFPYGFAPTNEAKFTSAVEQGYLVSDGKGGLHLTEEGQKNLKRLNQALDAAVAKLQPIPAEDLKRLVDYLARLADASFSAPRPSAKWLCSYKRNNMNPGADASMPRRFIYLYDQVAAYRDDAYVLLWQAHGVAGHTWNTLDMLNQNNALAFDALYEKLKAWGVPQDVHAEDVKELARRGWVEEISGVYQVTAAGTQVRAEVEAETERLFFAPWACLNESELEELASLASQLRDGLGIPSTE